ncbi:MAG: NfeD family protein [Treponema sp.]|nr:NfeD family protein [Treponema sp.]
MNIFFLNNLHWFWFVLTVLFVLTEIFTIGLTTLWFAIGSLLMIFLSFLRIPFWWQILIFLIISSLLLFLTRPLLIKKLKIGKEKTNINALIGKTCLVTKSISKLEKGEAKVNGVLWSAKSEDNSEIPKGSECKIIAINGATLIIQK